MKSDPSRRSVLALGWVSFLTDVSSEMIYPLLPVFLTTVLGASAGFLGVIEGAAETTAALLKLASGWWSDRVKKRKPLIVGGYALASAARPLGIDRSLSITGDFPARPVLACLDHDGSPSAAHRTLFHQELIRNGVFMPWVCPSFRHGPAEIERTALAFVHAAQVYARAIEARSVDGLLDGPPIKPVFRRFN